MKRTAAAALRRAIAAAIVATLSALACVAPPPEQPFSAWVGVPAPDLEVTTLDGQRLRLRDLRGRRVVVDLWATWCPPCRLEIPHFIRLAREQRDKLTIIGLSNESEEILRPYAEEQGMNYPVASTSTLPEPFHSVESIPTAFFIDRRGVIQSVLIGYHDEKTLRQHALAADYDGDVRTAPSQ